MTPAELLEARKRLGVTQQEMAERLGMARDGYCLTENGKRPITKRTVLAVNYLLLISEREREESKRNKRKAA